jgi:hypothetical protein
MPIAAVTTTRYGRKTRPLKPWEGYYKTQPASLALREKGRRVSRLDASVLLDA